MSCVIAQTCIVAKPSTTGMATPERLKSKARKAEKGVVGMFPSPPASGLRGAL